MPNVGEVLDRTLIAWFSNANTVKPTKWRGLGMNLELKRKKEWIFFDWPLGSNQGRSSVGMKIDVLCQPFYFSSCCCTGRLIVVVIIFISLTNALLCWVRVYLSSTHLWIAPFLLPIPNTRGPSHLSEALSQTNHRISRIIYLFFFPLDSLFHRSNSYLDRMPHSIAC